MLRNAPRLRRGALLIRGPPTSGLYRDGVDGSLRHQLCQNEVVAISDKGAVREPDYPHWHGYVEAFFSAARGGCGRAAGVAPEAAAQRGVGVFCQAAANRCRDGGLRRGALLGTGAAQARPRGEADGAAAREGLRQAQQERRTRRRGTVRGDEPADDAVRAGKDRRAARGADAGGGWSAPV